MEDKFWGFVQAWSYKANNKNGFSKKIKTFLLNIVAKKKIHHSPFAFSFIKKSMEHKAP
jgi:hypothetical protein